MTVEYLECPQDYNYHANDTLVFLAGGITNCRDWQQDVVQMFKERCPSHMPVTLANPRRANFDITDPSVTEQQIEWEHEYLKDAHMILFWFSPETMCPITLYELGVAAARGDTIFVGCDPEYQRKTDVVKQLSLITPRVKVVFDLLELVDQVIERI